MTEQLQQQIAEQQSRPLEGVYPIVFVDGARVAVRTAKGVLKKCVYTVLGVNVSGKQGWGDASEPFLARSTAICAN